jgi:hypothetical protein
VACAAQATGERLKELERQHSQLAGQIEGCGAHCSELREQEEALRRDLAEAGDQRYRLLLKTTRQQRMAKRYEEVDGGRYKPQVRQSGMKLASSHRAGAPSDELMRSCAVGEERVVSRVFGWRWVSRCRVSCWMLLIAGHSQVCMPVSLDGHLFSWGRSPVAWLQLAVAAR